ncbi:hypothetical protein ACQP3R_08220 [Bacillus inaquosorum]|uniref:hypothetical protein n=1 Tax=Bacillus inaquosorum TaxID=483913 RepID=UPI003D00893E
MSEKQVKLLRLKCNETDDDDKDELFMFCNGSRFWPPSGIFSMTKDVEIGMSFVKDFGGDQNIRFSLRDDESPLGSDSLGWVDIPVFKPTGQYDQNFEGGEGGSYTLTYKIREFV